MSFTFTPGSRNDGQAHIGTTEKPANPTRWRGSNAALRRSLRWLGYFKFNHGLVHYRNADSTVFFKETLGQALIIDDPEALHKTSVYDIIIVVDGSPLPKASRLLGARTRTPNLFFRVWSSSS